MASGADLDIWDGDGDRGGFTRSGPLQVPLVMLEHFEPSARELPPPRRFSGYRVGMVIFQLACTRQEWRQTRPWSDPARAERMASLAAQLVRHCTRLGQTFDLLAFPSGLVNAIVEDPGHVVDPARLALAPFLSSIRRHASTVGSVVFGLDLWASAQRSNMPQQSEEMPTLSPSRRVLVAYESSERPQLLEFSAALDNGSSHVECRDQYVRLCDRRIRLSCDEDPIFMEVAERARQARKCDGAELWINPIPINHPSGGVSPGHWPCAGVENALRDSLCPIFLPHFRRDTSPMSGPFWFAGHPDHARSHRWQPSGQLRFRSLDGNVQLLVFDIID